MKVRLKPWGDTKIIPIVGVFVFNEHGELLLLQRHIEDLGGGQWATPAGRIEPGEVEDQAIVRELFEETGVRPAALRPLGAHLIHMPHGTVHMTSYQTTIPKQTTIVLDPEEHHAYAWFSPTGLLDEEHLLWGIPSIMRDFRLLDEFDQDPTLADGSSVELIR